MTEFEVIQNEIDAVERKYLGSVMDIISDYKNENKTKTDYKGRQIYELLQNADDCYSAAEPQISVRIELSDNLLIIQNTGVPFSARGIVSLMHTDASSKYEGTIGNKGLGFRAVLNWAKRIAIYTNEFCVDFSEERAVEKLKRYRQDTKASFSDELSKLDRTAILTAAEVHESNDEIKKWLSPMYATAIVLYCDEAFVAEIENQLTSLRFEELLFLKHVNNIEISTSNDTRHIESIKENEMCIIQEADSISQWRVWTRQGEILQDNGERKQYELMIAYSDDEAVREITRKNGVLYSYFKTDIPMSFPFLIHGTFELTSERNSLVKDHTMNRRILDRLIEFICEIGNTIARENTKCDYEALRFLLPSESLGQLDREYGFTNKLKEKIKNYRIFPTINHEYISINEVPRYSDRRYDEILFPATCRTLLMRASDAFVAEYIGECGIKFYSNGEIVDLINKDAQYYVDHNLNADLIVLYYDTFIRRCANPQAAPKLLTDSNGKLVCDPNVGVFNNPSKQFDLPEWGRTYLLNPELEKALSKHLGFQGRDLADKLKAFKLVRYSFDGVLKELVSQSKDNLEKTKDTIAWLYECWEQNNHAFPSESGIEDIRIISRENEIISISKCYLGTEYGNGLGERITSVLEDAVYVGSPEQIGLRDKCTDDVKMFLNSLGILRFPAIKPRKLEREDTKAYIQYNALKHPLLFVDKFNSYSHEAFFSQWEKEIWISWVENIDTIISKADFYDVICWLLEDQAIYKCVTSENETCDTSVMKGKPAHVQIFREVRKGYMRSFLRKIFTETQWLPTQSGNKVSVGNCTLLPHKLSPIVEVLDIDYGRLGGKSRKEIELLFEKLGVAEDITDLSAQKIYEILYELYISKADYSITKQIYAKLNLVFKAEMIDSMIVNNPAYEKFKADGGVLAKQNGEYTYLPVKDVYYVDRKIYSEDVLKKYPLLVLEKKAGAPKIQKMFCVQSVHAISDVQVDCTEHELNAVYKKEFQRILPYLYAKRISVDSKNTEFRALRYVRIILAKEAMVSCRIGAEEKQGMLRDYEHIYKGEGKVAYIKIPPHIEDIGSLKDSVKFRSAVAEVITTILNVDSVKDAFLIILACKSIKEIEDYFIENGDDDLTILNMAKEKFPDQVERKAEFWSAIENACGLKMENQYADLMQDFNYDDLNNDSSCCAIISLFREIGISVDQYNQYAFDKIDLRAYYRNELRKRKVAYREKYFIYMLRVSDSIKTKSEFEAVKLKYDELALTAPNSVDAQINKIFENSICVSLDVLDRMEGDVEELVAKLITDQPIPVPESTEISTSARPEIDYADLDSQIASSTSAEAKIVDLSAVGNKTETTGSSRKSGGNYGLASTKSKEENGFIAESKVYHTLCAQIGPRGSVKWVSGNGHRAKANSCGDDSLGYDIWYSDEDGKKHYVEVKGSTSEHIEFVLTKNELEFAERCVADGRADEYEIWYVRIIDKTPSVPYKLGNILMLGENESFFNNSRFSVEHNEFKIRALARELS